MSWLLVLFVVVPLVEFALLWLVGEWLGLAATLLLIVCTGLVGGTLARAEGFRVWNQWREELAAARIPGLTTAQGLLVLVGGILLVTPGVLTDLVGLVFVIPPTRRAIAQMALKRLAPRLTSQGVGDVWPDSGHSAPPAVVETTGRAVDEPKN